MNNRRVLSGCWVRCAACDSRVWVFRPPQTVPVMQWKCDKCGAKWRTGPIQGQWEADE